MMDHKKQILLAAALGASWMGLALWQWQTAAEPVRVPLTNVSGLTGSRAGREPAGGLRVHTERLAFLQTQREATFTTPRNIFGMPHVEGAPPLGRQTSSVADVSVSAGEAREELIAVLEQYRYLGFLRVGGDRRNKDIAVLSKDDEIVTARVGERLEDRLVLKAIAQDSVTIRDTRARVEQLLPLSEESSAQP